MKIVDRDGDFNFALLLALPALFAVLFAVGAIRRPERARYDMMIFAAVIAAVSLLCLWFILREQVREDRFRAWLVEHLAELHQDGASWHGITLTAESQVHRYTYMFSLVLVRFTVPGRPLVVGLDDLPRCRWGYNAVTLLLGWWFISGPIYTPLTVYRNFKGAQPISIAEYMHAMGRRGPQGHA